MRSRSVLVAIFALPLLVLSGCSPRCTPGTNLIITGPSNDTGQWVSTSLGGPLACDGTCQLAAGGPFSLNASGQQSIPNVIVASVGTTYSTEGVNGSCMGTTTWSGAYGCPASITLPCLATAANGAHGDAVVEGKEGSMVELLDGRLYTIYNEGMVSITINGQTISTSYGQGSTAQQLAMELAAGIQANSTLAGQFTDAGLGTEVDIAALSGGSQYDYPWSTSCTHSAKFPPCSFYATLQPSGPLTQ